MSYLQRCIKLKQWQNAANIAGCSVHSIRSQYDEGYLLQTSGGGDAPVKRRSASDELEIWRQSVLARARASRWALREVSLCAGLRPQSVAELLRGQWVPSDKVKEAINDALDRIERGEAMLDPEVTITPEASIRWREQVRARIGRMPYTFAQISVAAGCGSTWLSNLLRSSCLPSQSNVARVDQILDSLEAGRTI